MGKSWKNGGYTLDFGVPRSLWACHYQNQPKHILFESAFAIQIKGGGRVEYPNPKRKPGTISQIPHLRIGLR